MQDDDLWVQNISQITMFGAILTTGSDVILCDLRTAGRLERSAVAEQNVAHIAHIEEKLDADKRKMRVNIKGVFV